MRIAVAGGTGAVGRHVVSAISARGHEPVVLARSTGVDLTDRAAVVAALAGCDAVIDVASVQTLSGAKSTDFFRTTTENLLAAEAANGGAHHVELSIVGAAAVGAGYYAGKKVQEELISASPGAWTILRATQFHEFVPQALSRARFGGLVLAPRGRTRTVAAAEVAAELVDLALDAPRGFAGELAGPEEESLPQLIRRYLKASDGRGRVLEVSLPGAMGRAMRDGGLLPGPTAKLGTQTFEQWLARL
jgi:uncharacterized protein YbjT (DUF2867 family)